MDRLQSMRVFLQVADEGGFAAAGRKLDLDPAMVTRLVVDLETHLGSRLLQRTTRRVALTPAGEDYLARVRLILADIDEADASVQGQTRELRGRLRILAPPVVSTHMLAPAMADFQRSHPEIQLDIRVLDMPDPPIEEFDLTFLNGAAPVPADIVVREVTHSHAVLCAAPAYLKEHGTPLAPGDLAGHRILRLRPASGRMGPLRLIDPTHEDAELLLEVPTAVLADHTDTLLRAHARRRRHQQPAGGHRGALLQQPAVAGAGGAVDHQPPERGGGLSKPQVPAGARPRVPRPPDRSRARRARAAQAQGGLTQRRTHC
jgi:DNA-binding transcriptional LysR family regulator